MEGKICLLLLAAIVAGAHARATAEEMRRALNVSPVFSHKRGSAVPVLQNVDIVLPASDPDIQPITSSVTPGSTITAGRPVMQQRSEQNQASIVNKRESQPAVAANVPTDRNSNKFMNVRPIPSQELSTNKQECSFQIPSFLMPDPDQSLIGSSQRCPSFLLPGPSINPNLVTLLVEHWTGVSRGSSQQLRGVQNKISQMEFEQKCLVPALRAHVLGGSACRSRELTVYLEWLLYLRQKLFNI